jgi:cofilin
MKIRSAYQYIVFKITDDKKSIVVEEKGAKGASFADFTSKLPDGDCRYAILDVEINTKSGATTNKLIFVAWYAPGRRVYNSVPRASRPSWQLPAAPHPAAWPAVAPANRHMRTAYAASS